MMTGEIVNCHPGERDVIALCSHHLYSLSPLSLPQPKERTVAGEREAGYCERGERGWEEGGGKRVPL